MQRLLLRGMLHYRVSKNPDFQKNTPKKTQSVYSYDTLKAKIEREPLLTGTLYKQSAFLYVTTYISQKKATM